MRNQSTQTEFILLGLTDDLVLQIVIFLYFFFFFFFYLCVEYDRKLKHYHSQYCGFPPKIPMYFLVQNFSLVDISFTTVYMPRFLVSLVTKDRTICYISFMTQFCLFVCFLIFLWVTEFYLLAAVSYDRYVAICKPLSYTSHEWQSLPPTCTQFLGNWIPDDLSSSDFRAQVGLLWFQCHWSFYLWFFSHPTDLLFRYTFPRADGLFLTVVTLMVTLMLATLLCVYHQDNSQFPFCTAKDQSPLYLFFPHDCSFQLLMEAASSCA